MLRVCHQHIKSVTSISILPPISVNNITNILNLLKNLNSSVKKVNEEIVVLCDFICELIIRSSSLITNIQLAKNRMRLPDEYFIERNVGDLKIPILCPENCNQSGASISAKMLVTWLKKRFYFKLQLILLSLRLRSVSFKMVRYTRYRNNSLITHPYLDNVIFSTT